MRMVFLCSIAFYLIGSTAFLSSPANEETVSDGEVLSYTIDPGAGGLAMYYQNDSGQTFRSFRNLETALAQQGRVMTFAMNGGMYMEDRQPLGLYIEKGKKLRPLNTRQTAHGNFYLQPNGVFFLHEDGTAEVCQTTEFEVGLSIEYATQSGPMLVINGNIHSGLTEGSTNLNVRNGVGILPDGSVLFAMSRGLTNFYDFATFFKEQGCENALYLDGFVSRTYLPSQNEMGLSGNFGVIIAESR